MHKLYSVKTYKGWTTDNIKSNYKKYNIDVLQNKLKKDNCYHMRIDKTKDYIFFGDVDGHESTFKEFSKFLITFFKNAYNIISISPEDISFTKNDSKKGSYHYSIPKIYCSCEKMKEIVSFMQAEYIKIYNNKGVIDTSIYSDHWFRYPNQTKECVKNTEHFIVVGNMRDFIVEYIPKKSKSIEENICLLKSFKINNKIYENKKYLLSENNNHSKYFFLNDVQIIIDSFSKEIYDEHKPWIYVGMCLFNISNNQTGLDMWINMSKKGKKYKEGECEYNWNTFKEGKYRASYYNLLALLMRDNSCKYKEFVKSIDPQLFKTIDVNKFRILGEDKDLPIVNKYMKKWTNENKIFAIKSYYGSGKTYWLKQIMRDNKFKRILWISYRQLYTASVCGELEKEFNIISYKTGKFDSDKLMCQVESLKNINTSLKYDLVVLDEIESILNQTSSGTCHNKKETFEILETIIEESDKVVALDGDFGNRAFTFLNKFEEDFDIIRNIHKPPSRKFIFTNNHAQFEKMIDAKLKNKKKVVIPSMGEAYIRKIHDKYKDTYKCILHTANTDDKLKDDLKDVNKTWGPKDLISYTNSIGAGIDYTVEDVDNIFVVLASKSCSQRDLTQMINRIRHVKCSTIYVYLNNIPYITNEQLYVYENVDYYHNALNLCFENEYKIKIKNSLFAKIRKYNDLEDLNKHPNLFITGLLKLLDEKNCTYEYDDIKSITKKENISEFMKDKILNTEDIDKKEFQKLLELQKNSVATEEDKLKIKKHLLKSKWKVKEINEDNIDVIYKKGNALDNYEFLKNTFEQKKDISKMEEDDVKPDTWTEHYKKEKKVEIVIDFIKSLGFDKIINEEKISKEEFDKRQKNCVKKANLFKKRDLCYMLFGWSKKKQIDTGKYFIRFINSFIGNYGLKIYCDKISKRVKNKIITTYSYKLYPIKDLYELIK